MGLTRAAIDALISAGNVNTFLNNPQEVEIEINYTGAGVDVDFPTGIILPDLSALTNCAFSIQFFIEASADGQGADTGFFGGMFGWGASPGAHPLPTILSTIIASYDAGALQVFSSTFANLKTSASGELIVVINTTLIASADYFGTWKILLSPIKQFPFQPVTEGM